MACAADRQGTVTWSNSNFFCGFRCGDRPVVNQLEAKLRRVEDRISKLVEAVVGEMVG